MINNKKCLNLFSLSEHRTFLMGVAISLVLYHHLTVKVQNGLIGKAYMFFRVTGAMGVDIFLFLSAIGLYVSFSKNNDIALFYKKRFIRIIPTYLIICTPFYLHTIGDIKYFLSHLFLISFWTEGNGDWFIAAIIVLYLLYPLLYQVLKKIGRIKGYCVENCVWLIATIFIAIISPVFFDHTNRLWARIPVFLFGLFMANPILSHKDIPNKHLLPILIINVVSLGIEAIFCLQGAEVAYSFWPRLVYFPLSISFIIGVIFILNRTNVKRSLFYKFMCLLGTITLEIYLLNQRLINFFTNLTSMLHIKNEFFSLSIGNALGVIATIVISYMVHQIVSNHMISGIIKRRKFDCKF